MNRGKMIGFVFIGFGGAMQVGVVGFLIFKRNQLMTIKDRYEPYSAS
ncbi:hypothetical protein LINGRAHAP2_LOCUS12199 [Linum grandiflorum]